MNRRLSKFVGHTFRDIRISHQATDVWKAIKTAVRLVEEYMIRVMSVSSFNDAAAN